MSSYLVSSRDWQDDYYVVDVDKMSFAVVHHDKVPKDAQSCGYIGKANISKRSRDFIVLRVDTIESKVIFIIVTRSKLFKIDLGYLSHNSSYYVYTEDGKTGKFLVIGQSYVLHHKYIPFRVQEMRRDTIYKWLPDEMTFTLHSSMSYFKAEPRLDFSKM